MEIYKEGTGSEENDFGVMGANMNYNEYEELIRGIPFTETLEYQPAVFWVHREVLPLGVASIGDDASGIIKIPNFKLNSYSHNVPVIAISKSAFANQERITDIVLPTSLEAIPEGAFSGCSGLKRITLPKSITYIGEGTFAGCDSLEDVYYEGSPEEWKHVKIVHQKHEVEFGSLVPGTPVQTIIAERFVHIPGNDALLVANIHFRCNLSDKATVASYGIKTGNSDVTNLFRTM